VHDGVERHKVFQGSSVAAMQEIRQFCLEEDVDMLMPHYKDFKAYPAARTTDVELITHLNGSPFWFENNDALLPYLDRDGFDEIIDDVEGHSNALPTGKSLKNHMKGRTMEWVQRRAVSDSSAFFTLTEQVADELEFLYGRRPSVVLPGIDESWQDQSAGDRPGAFPDTEYVLFNVGRIDRRKRNGALIEVVDELSSSIDVGAVLGGGGNDELVGELEVQIDSLGLSDRVMMPGYIPDTELPRYYGHADLVAHPAWVAYGLVPLEAYLMGTPVAISTDTMVREVLEGAPGVSIIPPEIEAWVQELEQMISSPGVPDSSILPTWQEYCRRKEAVLIDEGVL